MRCRATCRTVRLPGPGRAPARWRRATACALVAAFALLFVAPALEAAVDAGSSRCCRRGVCCHHRSAADTTCIRGVCPCGGHDRGTPASPAHFDALMPRVSAVFSDDAAVARPRDPAVTPQPHDSTPPHGPPRLSL